jgi:hypothetical protein
MPRILKGSIEVELKSNVHNPVRSILDIERVMVETDFSSHNHVPQSMLTVERTFENKGNRHRRLLIIEYHPLLEAGWSKRLSGKAAASTKTPAINRNRSLSFIASSFPLAYVRHRLRKGFRLGGALTQ